MGEVDGTLRRRAVDSKSAPDATAPLSEAMLELCILLINCGDPKYSTRLNALVRGIVRRPWWCSKLSGAESKGRSRKEKVVSIKKKY